MTSTAYYALSIKNGEFVRPETRFRDWIKADGSTPYLPEKGRYHLYVSLACPWSHRAVLVRKLRKLEDVITLSVTHPVWNEKGWCFTPGPGVIPDSVNHKNEIVEIYRLADPTFEDDETVPILWDKKTGRLVNNESLEIIRMFDTEFRAFGDPEVDLYPVALRSQIDDAIRKLYSPINNGVYQTGFARTQPAYDRAVTRLFENLDQWEESLGRHRFVCGDQLTEADVALFVTLIRFDAVYYTHFKCNIRRIIDYPHLWRWVREVYHTPGVAETCEFDHIKQHYYRCHTDINPFGIVPRGPALEL